MNGKVAKHLRRVEQNTHEGKRAWHKIPRPERGKIRTRGVHVKKD